MYTHMSVNKIRFLFNVLNQNSQRSNNFKNKTKNTSKIVCSVKISCREQTSKRCRCIGTQNITLVNLDVSHKNYNV